MGMAPASSDASPWNQAGWCLPVSWGFRALTALIGVFVPAWSREPSPMPLCAAPCRCSQSRSCKYALFLTPPPLCQRGGRRFEPGLVLQMIINPVKYSAWRGCCVQGWPTVGQHSVLPAEVNVSRRHVVELRGSARRCSKRRSPAVQPQYPAEMPPSIGSATPVMNLAS